MGGTSVDSDWYLASPSNEPRTVVLVGKTGNGKSATGNSIIRKDVFKSKRSSSGVTTSCEIHTTVFDGQTVTVIDTPGLFDISAESEFVGQEIANCINMAKDGIHGVIVVFSVSNRFSKEEETALRSLQTLFGDKIFDYMIVVFTGGDLLKREKESLEDYLGSDCPEPLKDILTLCKNRCVLFNNYAEDERTQFEQVQQLLSFVNMVVSENGGQPYTDEFLTELKKGAMKLNSQVDSLELEGYSNKEILKRITEMVESKLREATVRLEQRLKEEQAARLEAEENAKQQLKEEQAARLMAEENAKKQMHELREQQAARLQAEENSNKEIRELRERLEKAHEELRKHGENRCAIL